MTDSVAKTPAKAARKGSGKAAAKSKSKAPKVVEGKAGKKKPRAAATPPSASPAPAAAAETSPDPTQWLSLLRPEQRQAMERLSVNLAKAALSAQGALAENALRTAENPAALKPDPLNLTPAFGEVLGRLASQPDRLLRAQAELLSNYMDLWHSTARRIAGEEAAPVVEPNKGDKRFVDPDWQQHAVFDVMKQSYLLTTNWLNGLVSEVEDVAPDTKRRVEFYMKMLTDAFSPSNFLMSNPAALREAVDTQGESIIRGMENFAGDVERGGGQLRISQVDLTKFEVGVNVATAPGKVIYRNAILEVLQFEPATGTVYETPLLIFPPWINKFYILDLRPQNSMIRWLSQQGFTVFVASWVNPGPALAEKTFEDYMLEGVYPAIDAVLKQSGAKQVNTVGYCIAGTMMSCTLAHMAARKDKRVASNTFFAAQQDFSESGDLRLFTDEDWLRIIEIQMDNAGGVLPGDAMAETFNSLRSNDLIWSYYINNYLMGREPRPFDLLFWNADQTRMPKALHMFYLRRFYRENALAEGDLQLGGEQLDLGKVKTPVYIQAGREDHIAPFRSVYKGARLFGGPVRFVLAGSGHIAGVINPPDANKYQHWTNEALPDTLEAWLEDAAEHPGSWWNDWKAWLSERSGQQVPARDPSKGPLKPLADAPGDYVRVKS